MLDILLWQNPDVSFVAASFYSKLLLECNFVEIFNIYSAEQLRQACLKYLKYLIFTICSSKFIKMWVYAFP